MCECHDRVFLILCITGPGQISERHDRVFLLSVQALDIFLNAITGDFLILFQALARFLDAKTGYPFIDAGITQLKVEGWIHHIVRNALRWVMGYPSIKAAISSAGLTTIVLHYTTSDNAFCFGSVIFLIEAYNVQDHLTFLGPWSACSWPELPVPIDPD